MPQKVIADKILLIKQIGIFSDLLPYQIEFISKKSEFLEYKKDEVIYKEGDPKEAFYLIISGRVRIFARQPGAEVRTLEYLHRGSYFGMLSLLTDEPHSVTAQILNDSLLMRIDKEDFHNILKCVPQLALHFSSMLARRLKRKDLGPKSVFESTIISVFGIQKDAGRASYALSLAKALCRETGKTVVYLGMPAPGEKGVFEFLEVKGYSAESAACLQGRCLDEEKVKNSIVKHETGIHILHVPYSQTAAPSYTGWMISILNYLINFYDYCIIDLPHAADECVMGILGQSDLIHLITDCSSESVNSTSGAIKEIEGVLKEHEKKLRVIVTEKNGPMENCRLIKSRVYATIADPMINEQEYNLALRRIAREIGGVLTGLALGAGAAWGLSHIGVIKVLEKEGITIDVVAGASMGALIGALWAAGNSGIDMERIAIENKGTFSIFKFRDFQFPLRGLISDRKTVSFLRRYFGDKTFQDLKVPLRIVAAGLEDRKEVVIDQGPLAEALRASISIPGIYTPVKDNDRHLIDGGILDPVPVSVLSKMGVNKIIAVNTLPNPDNARQAFAIERAKTAKERDSFRKRMKLFFTPNIMDIITNSIEALEYTVAELSCRQADAVIHPCVAGFSWHDFFNPEKMILLGEEACARALPDIKKAIEE